MKKIVLIALISVFVASLAAAQCVAKGGQPCEGENLTGKVDSVTLANPATGTKPMITVADNKGEKTVFEVTPTTTLYDADMKPITLDAIKKDASVKVKGMSLKEGTAVAISIRLVK